MSVKKADIVVVSYHGGFERDIDTEEPTEDLTGENEAPKFYIVSMKASMY